MMRPAAKMGILMAALTAPCARRVVIGVLLAQQVARREIGRVAAEDDAVRGFQRADLYGSE